jgi:hypothetical protein
VRKEGLRGEGTIGDAAILHIRRAACARHPVQIG